MGQGEIQWNTSPVGATTPHPPDDHDLLSCVETFLDQKLTVPPNFHVALDSFPESSLSHMSIGVWEVGRVVQLNFGVPQVPGAIKTPSVDGFVGLTNQLDVFLRHR